MFNFARMETSGVTTRPQTEGLGAMVKVGKHVAFLGSKAENDQLKRMALLVQKIPLRPLPVYVPGLSGFGGADEPTSVQGEDTSLLSKLLGSVKSLGGGLVDDVLTYAGSAMKSTEARVIVENLTPQALKDLSKEAQDTLQTTRTLMGVTLTAVLALVLYLALK